MRSRVFIRVLCFIVWAVLLFIILTKLGPPPPGKPPLHQTDDLGTVFIPGVTPGEDFNTCVDKCRNKGYSSADCHLACK